MVRETFWQYKLYALLLVGQIGGAERRGSRVFIHLPTAARYLSVPSARLKEYLESGVECALFFNLKKRLKIWSFDLVLPTDIKE